MVTITYIVIRFLFRLFKFFQQHEAIEVLFLLYELHSRHDRHLLSCKQYCWTVPFLVESAVLVPASDALVLFFSLAF